MKLPSLWPVAFFAGGILLSSHIAVRFQSPPRVVVISVAALLFIAVFCLLRQWNRTALLLSAVVWIFLGLAAASLVRSSVAANLAGTLIENGTLDKSAALRWRGRLRSDPRALPWGTRYEINLDEVETASGVTPVSGGLLLTAYHDESQGAASLPARAGDRIEALVHALPIRNFGDPGSFDQRAYLALQGIELQGTLRNLQLLTILDDHPHLTIANRVARLRGKLLNSVDDLFSSHPEQAALARAMLLGDRGFVEHDRVVEYQQTGVYHVLVLAGLHVGALTAFIIWAGRKLRIALLPRTLLTIIVIAGYVGIVEDRPPILRAAIMAALYLCAQLIYRRMDLLNMASLSALAILAARPSEITDASFLLSFSAIAVIGAVAVPWIAQSSEPYRRGLEHLADITRDVSHEPRVIQFRMEMRAAIHWITSRIPPRFEPYGQCFLVAPLKTGIFFWELIVLSAILQLGMMPPMAYYFHRVTLVGPLANVGAVLLTGLIVPLGLFTLVISLVARSLAIWLAKLLGLFSQPSITPCSGLRTGTEPAIESPALR
jgi:competence protein ComEC